MTLRVLKKAQSALKTAAPKSIQEGSAKASNAVKEEVVKIRPRRQLFGWGQSKYNILPIAAGGDSSSSKGSFLSMGQGTQQYDHPVELDFSLNDDNIGDVDKGKISSLDTIESISAGVDNSGFVTSDGHCFTWGANSNGQLGYHDASASSASVPREVDMTDELREVGVAKLVLGENFSALLDKGGDLYTFGFGGSALKGMGCLGHGNSEQYTSPKKVESLIEDGCVVKDVCVGKAHTTVVTAEGELLTAGAGSWGRLGNLDADDQIYFEPIELLAGQKVDSIVGGKEFTLALTDDGIIHGWGRNDNGQLGNGGGIVVDMYSMNEMPTPIEGQLEGRRVVKVAAGDIHAACITDKGELFYWGMKIHLEPVLVHSLLHTKCVDVFCGGHSIYVTTEEGYTYALGKGKYGVLGNAQQTTSWEPVLIEGLIDKNVVDLTAGRSHILCLVEDANSCE